MRSDLADMVRDAVSDTLFEPVDVRPVGDGQSWRTVQGRVKRAVVNQQLPHFVSEAIVPADEVHLLAADFVDAKPVAGWWVRFAGPEDMPGQRSMVMRVAEPAHIVNTAARFIAAPLKANTADVPL